MTIFKPWDRPKCVSCQKARALRKSDRCGECVRRSRFTHAP